MAYDLQSAPEPSMASLVGGIVHDVQVLIQQELALAKGEVTNELNKTKKAAIFLGIGSGSAALGGLLLVSMLVYLLHWASSERLPLWGCYGIVGTALMSLAGGLVFLGMRRAGAVHWMPEQTIATIKDNVAWINTQTSTGNGRKRSDTTWTKPVTTSRNSLKPSNRESRPPSRTPNATSPLPSKPSSNPRAAPCKR